MDTDMDLSLSANATGPSLIEISIEATSNTTGAATIEVNNSTSITVPLGYNSSMEEWISISIEENTLSTEAASFTPLFTTTTTGVQANNITEPTILTTSSESTGTLVFPGSIDSTGFPDSTTATNPLFSLLPSSDFTGALSLDQPTQTSTTALATVNTADQPGLTDPFPGLTQSVVAATTTDFVATTTSTTDIAPASFTSFGINTFVTSTISTGTVSTNFSATSDLNTRSLSVTNSASLLLSIFHLLFG